MHPMLKPALRRGWRDGRTMQFGVTSAHAVTLGSVDSATDAFLTLLDGTRGMPLLREEARRMDLPDGHADALVGRLTAAGLIDDNRGGGPGAAALRQRTAAMDRLRPDLNSLSVVDGEPGGAMRRLAARGAMRVQVRGCGRVGAQIAAVLAGAGVGGVEVRDGGCVRPWDVAPGGLPPEAVGERRDESARRAVRRAAPAAAAPTGAVRAARASPPPSGNAFALVVLAPRDGLEAYLPDPDGASELLSSGTPHLYAGVVEATGFVGPLVLPGATACAGCRLRRRVDADPEWLRVFVQWRSGRARRGVPAGDLALTATVAGLAASHALAFLDGDPPSSAGARWEAALPGLEWRADEVSPHPECGCGAGGGGGSRGAGGRERAAGRVGRQDTMAR
ncbi:ThiF family adenylyltransferase [Streptomyces sp. NPDC060194]|uniref:ThiF family adenylyltransferase n=1 Tax=Streptomyces sp. NPDC060194 TaxID=3347069 RepID=UPI003662003E